jgi:hypothetical protein
MARRVDATVCRWGGQEEGDEEKKARKMVLDALRSNGLRCLDVPDSQRC